MPFDGINFSGNNEALDKIDQLIDLLGSKDRWCKGALQTHDGRRCIVGALQAINAKTVLKEPILQAIEQVTGIAYRQIEAFNDHRSTTHARVLEVLHQARHNVAAGQVLVPVPRAAPRAEARLGKMVQPLVKLYRVFA